MRNKENKIKPFFLLILATMFIISCHSWDNFTTLYNTFYNEKRLLDEAEDEFGYQKEQVKNNPRVIVPDSSLFIATVDSRVAPPFMNDYVVTQQQRQAVQQQLDSIIIKGSKVLSFHPKSDYVVQSLYYIALAYFYKNEWLPSQIKCAEIVDKYPDNDLTPNALILYAKSLLIQRKFDAAEIMLSRTVDLAWQKRRYDILSEAFRLQAETKLYLNDLQEAIKPYKQAILQSDDKELKARWQLDLALLHYRIGKFDKAIVEFDKVFNYSPDYITTYETKLYKANSYTYLKKFDKAEKILTELENDGKYSEWMASTFAGQMLLHKMQGNFEQFAKDEKKADSAYTNNTAIIAIYYLRGKELYDSSKYNEALPYFAKSRITRTPVFNSANKMNTILSTWKLKQAQIYSPLESVKNNKQLNDSSLSALAKNLFELGRIHDQLGNQDSVNYYYSLACKYAPIKDEQTAKYLYVYSLYLENTDLKKSDSLLEVVVQKFPFTEYGKSSMTKLGYTKAYIIDTVQELFDSGTELMLNKEYQYSINQFTTLLQKFPNNKLEPRTLYSVGWLYERKLKNYDSALHYYKQLISKYPTSVYAQDVKNSVEYLTLVKNGEPIPDYLQKREQQAYRPQQDLQKLLEPINITNTQTPKQDEGFKIQDIFSDPSKLLDAGKELINKQVDKVKNFDVNKELDSLKKQISVDSLTKLKIDKVPEQTPDTTKHN
ncbi:MAG: tetratricopeptide repeat protein [Candidatus Kapaibacteriota bacterium]